MKIINIFRVAIKNYCEVDRILDEKVQNSHSNGKSRCESGYIYKKYNKNKNVEISKNTIKWRLSIHRGDKIIFLCEYQKKENSLSIFIFNISRDQSCIAFPLLNNSKLQIKSTTVKCT